MFKINWELKMDAKNSTTKGVDPKKIPSYVRETKSFLQKFDFSLVSDSDLVEVLHDFFQEKLLDGDALSILGISKEVIENAQEFNTAAGLFLNSGISSVTLLEYRVRAWRLHDQLFDLEKATIRLVVCGLYDDKSVEKEEKEDYFALLTALVNKLGGEKLFRMFHGYCAQHRVFKRQKIRR